MVVASVAQEAERLRVDRAGSSAFSLSAKCGRMPVDTKRPTMLPSSSIPSRVEDEELLQHDRVALHADDLADAGDLARAVARGARCGRRRRARALICWRIALIGMSKPDICIIISRRLSESRAELAWTVEIEPSWPVFMACSMSSDSAPRTSPTMMRSGRMRRLLRSEVALRDLAAALDVRRARLEPHDVRLLELELGRVLDGDDALVVGDERREAVEERRLAGARAAGDEDVQARPHHGAQQVDHLGRQRADADQVVDRERRAAEAADREDRPVERQRRDDGVHARAVGQARVDHRRALVDAAADARDDAVDDLHQVLRRRGR